MTGSHANAALPCPVCGGEHGYTQPEQPEDFEYGVRPKRAMRVVRCPECASRFIAPRPSIEELASFYPSHYHAYNEDHGWLAKTLVGMRSRARARRYMQLVRSRPIRLFDVGAGDCRHFDALARYRAFEFAGVEINPDMAAAACGRGYRVAAGTLEEYDSRAEAGAYDIVTMYQLVEHVISPAEMFRKSMELLKPGGYVMGQLPRVDSLDCRVFGRYWAGYHYPRHLQMISLRGMRLLLTRSGFRDIRVASALHLQAGLSVQNLLIGRFGYAPVMRHGKVPMYTALLMAAAPFCAFERAIGMGGMMDFMARKPLGDTAGNPV